MIRGMVAKLYVTDILYYTIINDNWAIGIPICTKFGTVNHNNYIIELNFMQRVGYRRKRGISSLPFHRIKKNFNYFSQPDGIASAPLLEIPRLPVRAFCSVIICQSNCLALNH